MNLLSIFNKYRSTYYEASKDLIKHTIVYSSSLLGLWYFRDSYLSIITTPLFALMNVRTYIVFHDCGHNSYTPNKTLNYMIGSILGIPVFTPFCWTYNHHNHHLTSGNKRNELKHSQNETVFYTLTGYKDMGYKRHLYRTIMHPLIFFTLISSFKFFILNRGSELFYKYNNHPYRQSINLILFDTIVNNIGMSVLLLYMNQHGIFYHYLCSMMCMSSISFIFFHNQHTFNPPYVVTNEKWNKKDSGLNGSSFIQVPKYLKFFFSGIEYHHLHHMNASIPGYNLHKVHEELIKNTNELDNITKLSMNDCYHNLWLTLYDETNEKYISFKEANFIKIKSK